MASSRSEFRKKCIMVGVFTSQHHSDENCVNERETDACVRWKSLSTLPRKQRARLATGSMPELVTQFKPCTESILSARIEILRWFQMRGSHFGTVSENEPAEGNYDVGVTVTTTELSTCFRWM